MSTSVKNAKSKTVKTTTSKQPKKAEVVAASEQNNKAWEQKMAQIVKKQEAENKAKSEAKAKALAEKKKPGVIKTIHSILESASKSKPVTQEQIIAKLVEEFPKREEKSMRNTIKAQIGGKKRPLRMEREKHIILNITENKAGVSQYFIEKL